MIFFNLRLLDKNNKKNIKFIILTLYIILNFIKFIILTLYIFLNFIYFSYSYNVLSCGEMNSLNKEVSNSSSPLSSMSILFIF